MNMVSGSQVESGMATRPRRQVIAEEVSEVEVCAAFAAMALPVTIPTNDGSDKQPLRTAQPYRCIASRYQVALPSPGYLGLITNWDGQWFERIATNGYHLPAVGDQHGKDALWAFAFLPVFPTLVGAMMTVTGLSFGVCVTIVNLIAGGAAMVVMFVLVERTAGRFAAGVAVLFVNSFVAAPLFQAAYSESIALLLVC